MALSDEQVEAIQTIQHWRQRWHWRLPLLVIIFSLTWLFSPYPPTAGLAAIGGWAGLWAFLTRWLSSVGRTGWSSAAWAVGFTPVIIFLPRRATETQDDFWLLLLSDLGFVFVPALLVAGVLYVISHRWLKIEDEP